MNVSNRTIFEGDNLGILRGIDSETIDLIYLDPPFNSNRTYEAPIGSEAAGAAFKDAWTLSDLDNAWHGEIAEVEPALYSAIDAAGETHGKSMKAYLIMMRVRMLELHRILKDTGSIYLHCDPTASHYLKTMMDSIFGQRNFRNEIVWNYAQTARGAKAISKSFPKNSDIILSYSKSKKSIFNKAFFERRVSFKGSGYQRDSEGRCFRTSPRGDYTDESIERLRKEGHIYVTKNGTIRIKYYEKCDNVFVYEKKILGNVWTDIPDMMHTSKTERTGYPTQKPLALLQRIIKASSRRGGSCLTRSVGVRQPVSQRRAFNGNGLALT